MNRFSKAFTIFTAMSLCLLTACSQNNDDPRTLLDAAILANPNVLRTVSEPTANYSDPIIGTWTNKNYTSTEMEKWLTLYTTRFSPDGLVEHYGNRNMDTGTWTRIDENTIIAYFDDCTYTGIGGSMDNLSPYQVTYTYDAEKGRLTVKRIGQISLPMK